MTTAQVLYGLRGDELVHIDDVARGLACLCECAACGRTLVAKKGELVSHHFAHDADDVDCNPAPESLIHAYAKQQIAKMRTLFLPPFEVGAEVHSNDGQVHKLYWRHRPHYRLEVHQALVEADLGSIKPDVLFETSWSRVAVEVYFRHRVPLEKIVLLRSEHHLSTVEVDLSDISVNAPAHVINAALSDIQRWQWLHNQHEFYLRGQMSACLTRCTKIFVPESPRREPKISGNTFPTKKLARADRLALRAKGLASELRAQPIPARMTIVRGLEDEMRIALHCSQIGLLPSRVPRNLLQACDGQSSLGMHPVLWQTGVFAKFCMVGPEFTVRAVEDWVRSAFIEGALETSQSTLQTVNGFTPPAEALYHFLRNLSAQGLLDERKGPKPWESRFAPSRSSKAEVLEELLARPPALQ